jgi:hypothetical protein
MNFKHTFNKSADINIWDIETVTNIPDSDIENSSFDIEYTVEFEARSWGIKGISIIIQKVTGQIEWYGPNFIGDEEQEPTTGTIEIDSDKEGWSVINKMEVTGEMICPNSIDINFKKKTIEIE